MAKAIARRMRTSATGESAVSLISTYPVSWRSSISNIRMSPASTASRSWAIESPESMCMMSISPEIIAEVRVWFSLWTTNSISSRYG